MRFAEPWLLPLIPLAMVLLPLIWLLLDRVRSHGDWEAWIEFFLEGVEQTAQGAVDTAQRLAALFQADTQRTQAAGRGAASALRLLVLGRGGRLDAFLGRRSGLFGRCLP